MNRIKYFAFLLLSFCFPSHFYYKDFAAELSVLYSALNVQYKHGFIFIDEKLCWIFIHSVRGISTFKRSFIYCHRYRLFRRLSLFIHESWVFQLFLIITFTLMQAICAGNFPDVLIKSSRKHFPAI